MNRFLLAVAMLLAFFTPAFTQQTMGPIAVKGSVTASGPVYSGGSSSANQACTPANGLCHSSATPIGGPYSLQSASSDGSSLFGDTNLQRDSSGNLISKGMALFGSNPNSFQTNQGGASLGCASSSSVNSGIAGRSICFNLNQVVNGFGRSVGNVVGATSGSWQVSHGVTSQATSYAAGIMEGQTNVYNKYTVGDFSPLRNFINFLPGGRTAASDENKKLFYLWASPMSPYIGRVTTGGSGVSLLTTAMTGGCGGGNDTGTSFCYGSQLPILQTNKPIYSGSVLSDIGPERTGYGTLTVSNTVTPSKAIGTLAASLPDATNAQFISGGATVSATVTISSGTPDPSGIACVAPSFGSLPETLNYTLSGSTITLSGHYYSSGTDNAATDPIYVFFGNSCSTLVPNVSTQSEGKKFIWWVVGATGPNTLAYVSYSGGNRSSDRGSSKGIEGWNGFTAGTSGKDEYITYPSAVVVAAFDPAQGPGSNPNGVMQLAVNDVALTPGDTVEQGLEPSEGFAGFQFNCDPGEEWDGSNVCHQTIVSRNVDVVNEILLNNPQSDVVNGFRIPIPSLFHLRTTLASTAGYKQLFQMDVPPVDGGAIFNVGTGGAGTDAYSIWEDNNGSNGSMSFRRSTGLVSFANNGGLSAQRGYYLKAQAGTGATSVEMVDPTNSLHRNDSDLSIGSPNLSLGVPVPSGILWAGGFNSTSASLFGGLSSSFHASGDFAVTTTSFTDPSTNGRHKYYCVPVFPGGVLGSSSAVFTTNDVRGPLVINASNTVSVTCGSAEPGYPSGTSYAVTVIDNGGPQTRNLGTAPVTDSGQGTITNLTSGFTQLSASADVSAYRFIAPNNGVVGFVPHIMTATPDTGFSRIGAGVIGVGNGTAGDTSGDLRAATFHAGGTGSGKLVCTQDGTNCPAAASQVNADWNATSGVAQILNKPVLGTMSAQSSASVAITGGSVAADLTGTIGVHTPAAGFFTQASVVGKPVAVIDGTPTVGHLAYFDTTSNTIADSGLTAAAINVGWSFDTCDPPGNGQPVGCSGTTTLPVTMPDANYQITCSAEGWSDNADLPSPYISWENHSVYGSTLPTASGSNLYYHVTWAIQNGGDHFHAHAYCLAHHN